MVYIKINELLTPRVVVWWDLAAARMIQFGVREVHRKYAVYEAVDIRWYDAIPISVAAVHADIAAMQLAFVAKPQRAQKLQCVVAEFDRPRFLRAVEQIESRTHLRIDRPDLLPDLTQAVQELRNFERDGGHAG